MLVSDTHLYEVGDISDELDIEVVVRVRGTTKMRQLVFKVLLVRVCHCVVVSMSQNEEKLPVLEPVVNTWVSFGTL